MKSGSNQSLLEAYPYLAEDSLYRADTSDFTKRTIVETLFGHLGTFCGSQAGHTAATTQGTA